MKKLLTILSLFLVLAIHTMAQGVPPPPVIGTIKVLGGGTDTTSISNRLNAKLNIADYIVREVPAGAINSSNLIFTLANTPVGGKESVFRNGILQDVTDYSISGGTITFISPPPTGSKVVVTYIKQ
jgi:hypothetical protein